MRLFRTVRHNPPQPSDFFSGEAEGRPRPARARYVRLWQGFSAFEALAQAREKARKYPAQGDTIAEFVISEDAGIEWEQTFGSGHYTVWGILRIASNT